MPDPTKAREVVFLDGDEQAAKDLVRRVSLFVETLATQGQPVVLRVSSDKSAAFWDTQLWTFKDGAFLPHSVFSTDWPADELVTIATGPVPPRPNAAIIALFEAPLDELTPFARVFELVRRDSEESLALSRQRWATWKSLGSTPTVRKDW